VKRAVIIGASTLLLALPAAAADLPVKALAPVAVVYPWNGPYIGLNLGYSWGPWDFSNAATTSDANVNGFLGGVQIGYNWQINPRWVVGLEADIQATAEKDSFGAGSTAVNQLGFAGLPGIPGCPPAGGACPGFNTVTTTTTTGEAKLPWFATFRGRVGLLIDPTLLGYFTGGLAVGNAKFETTSSVQVQVFRTAGPDLLATSTAAGAAFSESKTQAGWVLGAGAEKKINRNLSAKIEYLYLDFGTHTFFAGTSNATSVKVRDHVVRGGLNWAFN
jgi:outer membrane immunogenic protein